MTIERKNLTRHSVGGADVANVAPPPVLAPVVVDDFAWHLPWYVAYAKSRQEDVAKENLLRQGYSVYLPRMKILRRIRGHYRTRWEPFFPRYLFLQPGTAEHSIAPVRNTIGLTGIVRICNDPAVISPKALLSIRQIEIRQNAASDAELSPFTPGKRIRVVDGPLYGLEGVVTSTSQQRIIVLMQLLGSDTRVSMRCDQLQALN